MARDPGRGTGQRAQAQGERQSAMRARISHEANLTTTAPPGGSRKTITPAILPRRPRAASSCCMLSGRMIVYKIREMVKEIDRESFGGILVRAKALLRRS